MTRGHDAFEALAGAIVLGEATPDERAAFATHAASCASCRADVADAAVAAAVGAARDGERWRPSLDHLVAGRIRDARARRATVTLGALGWAVAASIVLNVAFASGFTGRLATAFRETGESRSGVVATRLVLESRPRVAVTHAVARSLPVARVAAAGALRHAAARSRADFLLENGPLAYDPAALVAHPPVRPVTKDGDAAVPDVLAGLDVDRAGGTRTVAFGSALACAGASLHAAVVPCEPERFAAARP